MKSICILRLSAIGDVCHALALVSVIRQRWPACQITWVLGKAEAQLMAGLDGVELVVFDKKAGFKGMRALWRQLSGRRFDALLHMQIALRASVLSLGIRAKRRLGFARSRAGEGQWLFTNEQVPAPDSVHVLDNFLAFAHYLGVSDPQPQWPLPVPIPEVAARKAAELLPDGQQALVICHSASKAERAWLAERYAAVADWACEQGLSVLLCGGPASSERERGQAISAYCQYPVTDLTGQTDLKTLWALLGRARVVLAPDTGPVHMASSQGVATIGLYAHSNPRRTGPYNHQQWVVNRYDANITAQTGQPWQQLPWGKRAKGEALMAGIGVDEVLDRLERILAE